MPGKSSRGIKIFMFTVPVIGDAQVRDFAEGSYKFWTVVAQDGRSALTIRETVGKVSLQQRVDDFIKNEMGFVFAKALLMPHHIAPANDDCIESWAKQHAKEMESAL